MGRGDRGGPVSSGRGKYTPPPPQSLLPSPPLPLPPLLIVRVSTRRNIDFTMKFANDDDNGGGDGSGGVACKGGSKILGLPRCVGGTAGKRGVPGEKSWTTRTLCMRRACPSPRPDRNENTGITCDLYIRANVWSGKKEKKLFVSRRRR